MRFSPPLGDLSNPKTPSASTRHMPMGNYPNTAVLSNVHTQLCHSIHRVMTLRITYCYCAVRNRLPLQHKFIVLLPDNAFTSALISYIYTSSLPAHARGIGYQRVIMPGKGRGGFDLGSGFIIIGRNGVLWEQSLRRSEASILGGGGRRMTNIACVLGDIINILILDHCSILIDIHYSVATLAQRPSEVEEQFYYADRYAKCNHP